MAVASAALDRENASLYAEAGVKESWIVLAEAQQIEIYRQPFGGRYLQKKAAGQARRFSARLCRKVQISLAELFSRQG